MEKTQNFKNTVFACYRGYITQGIVNNLSPLFFVLFQNKFGVKAKSMLILPRKYSTIKPNRVFSFRKSPNSICYSFDLFN